MTDHDDARSGVARQPRPKDFGLSDGDMKRLTPREILLLEEVPTIAIVVITALSIWKFDWWGIAVAVVALALLYAARLGVARWVWSPLDRARRDYARAMEDYVGRRRAHENAIDDREHRRRKPGGGQQP